MRSAKRTLTEMLLATAVIVAAGCGASVQSSVAPNARLGAYKTFAFYTAPGQPAKSVADQDIDSALRQSLTAKGFVEATSGSPDFLVSHHIKLQQELDMNGFGYDYGWEGGVGAYTYTEGTLIVDFVDAKTNKAFWRGTASQAVNHPDSPDAQRIEAAVEKLINKYPVNLAATPKTNM